MTDTSEKYYPIEQVEDISMRDREDAMGAYLMMFAALAAGLPLPILNLIAAVIYYYVNKGKSRFVKFHALQSLYSQIPTTLMNAGLVFGPSGSSSMKGHFAVVMCLWRDLLPYRSSTGVTCGW